MTGRYRHTVADTGLPEAAIVAPAQWHDRHRDGPTTWRAVPLVRYLDVVHDQVVRSEGARIRISLLREVHRGHD